jgi:FMN hydrolase / 5-amino-6-(5-phospho-D-ribitylamino)uracil phosphatase
MPESAGLLAPVQAISFDLDYTLWDLADVIQQAERELHAFLASRYPRVVERFDRAALYALRLELAERRPELRHNVTAWRKAALSEVARVCGYPGLAEEAFEVFIEARHRVSPYPDALPLLDRLHGRYRLGVITNGNADVSRLGLGHYFHFTVSAVDVGASKPDRLIFEAACNRAGVAPEQMLHVGDDAACDVVGAAEFGMQSVWLNRHCEPWPEGVERPAHVEVDSLTRLGELLLPGRTAP